MQALHFFAHLICYIWAYKEKEDMTCLKENERVR